jgi:hypothetical protein
MKLSPAVEYALASGWTSQSSKLICHEDRTEAATLWQSSHHVSRSYPRRQVPRSGARQHPGAGECEDEQSRTITVTPPDGTEAAAFCPRCSPQKRPLSVDQKIVKIEEW